MHGSRSALQQQQLQQEPDQIFAPALADGVALAADDVIADANVSSDEDGYPPSDIDAEAEAEAAASGKTFQGTISALQLQLHEPYALLRTFSAHTTTAPNQPPFPYPQMSTTRCRIWMAD